MKDGSVRCYFTEGPVLVRLLIDSERLRKLMEAGSMDVDERGNLYITQQGYNCLGFVE